MSRNLKLKKLPFDKKKKEEKKKSNGFFKISNGLMFNGKTLF